MTAIVGIRCKDGVVVGADSSATFGDGNALRTIEQPTVHKLEVIADTLILAGTGYVGHQQRVEQVLRKMWEEKLFQGKSDIDIAKLISANAIKDFADTQAMVRPLQFSALVAYPASAKPALAELPGFQMNFQPEVKRVDDLWFSSLGGGQPITDPFLALLRQVFWADGAPPVQGGIFTALWALKHACDVNPGGIKEPISIAVMEMKDGKPKSRMLPAEELSEHFNMVADATKHLGSFRDILEGKAEAVKVPSPGA